MVLITVLLAFILARLNYMWSASLLRLKDAARKLLLIDNITRAVIVAEPDTLPLVEVLS